MLWKSFHNLGDKKKLFICVSYVCKIYKITENWLIFLPDWNVCNKWPQTNQTQSFKTFYAKISGEYSFSFILDTCTETCRDLRVPKICFLHNLSHNSTRDKSSFYSHYFSWAWLKTSGPGLPLIDLYNRHVLNWSASFLAYKGRSLTYIWPNSYGINCILRPTVRLWTQQLRS